MSASTSISELHIFSWPKTELGVRFGLPLLVFCWLSPLLFAQFNGSLEGTITDASGAAVPDVAVDIVNEATGVSSKTRTSGPCPIRADPFDRGRDFYSGNS